jgi:predicted nucleic acid-binding protein
VPNVTFLLSAAWLVTGDQDLLVIETPLPVRILTAGEALVEVGFAMDNVAD